MRKSKFDKKIEDVLYPAFWAAVMLTLMEWKCTDWVIKIRDEAIKELKDYFSLLNK